MVTPTISQKRCAHNRILSVSVCDFRLSQLFISSSQLIKSKIKRQRGNNQKRNHAALIENSLQTDCQEQKADATFGTQKKQLQKLQLNKLVI